MEKLKNFSFKGLATSVGSGVTTSIVGIKAGVSLIGFKAGGIVAGSKAAAMMSSVAIASGGGVPAASSVAVLQSIGAAGLGTLAWPVAIGGACAGVGFYALGKKIMPKL